MNPQDRMAPSGRDFHGSSPRSSLNPLQPSTRHSGSISLRSRSAVMQPGDPSGSQIRPGQQAASAPTPGFVWALW